MNRPWLHLYIVVGLVILLASPAWAGFQAGVDAYARGDYDTALKEWRPLAEQGDAAAQHNLGLMYDKGRGVPQDYQEAMRWYRLATEQGFAKSQFNLGVMYDKGQGVPQSYQEAVRWYRLAAEQENASAQYNLGLHYARGQGAPKDYVLAHMWMNLAAAQGIERAPKMRDAIEVLMVPGQLAEAQRLAREWKAKGE